MGWRDDPRNAGQEHDLPAGTVLRWTPYTPSDGDHDHCVICWAKFVPPATPAGADTRERHHAGYATTEAHPRRARALWVCAACAGELAAELGWTLEGRPFPP